MKRKNILLGVSLVAIYATGCFNETSTASSEEDGRRTEGGLDTLDAGMSCGNGNCQLEAGESTCGCPEDCGSVCGDLCCNGVEDTTNCTIDCGQACGDGACNGTETTCTCVADCGSVCGDTCCNNPEAENSYTCPEDCGPPPPRCNDGECNGDENCSTCSEDCGHCAAACGDGRCEFFDYQNLCMEDLLKCHLSILDRL